jgi:hypothetical protein
MDGFRALMGLVGTAIDGAGVQVVVTGVLIAAFRFVFRKGEATYRTFRQDLGRASRPIRTATPIEPSGGNRLPFT